MKSIGHKFNEEVFNMQEVYFFRDVDNYQTLVEKNAEAIDRNSVLKRKMVITKTISLSKEHFELITNNLENDNIIFVEHIDMMYVSQGVWYCICLQSGEKSILVMSDGYPYPRYCGVKMQFGNRNK